MDAARPRVPRRLTVAGVVLALVAGPAVVGSTAAATAAEVAADAWTSATGGPGNARTNLGESVVTAATVAGVEGSWALPKEAPTPSAPTVVGRVVYHVLNAGGPGAPARLVASSAGTGEELWSVPIPGNAFVDDGVAVSGSLGIISVSGVGFRDRAGLLAVDLSTRRVAWSAPLPPLPPELDWLDPGLAAEVVVDAGRAYVVGGSTNLAAYRLSDGALLWSQPMTIPMVGSSIAVADGVVYTGNGSDGRLHAWSAASGKELWQARGGGTPVVAGGRVFAVDHSSVTSGVVAVDADGCGRELCPWLWRWSGSRGMIEIGGAASGSLFVAHLAEGDELETLVRLSAATGQAQWSAVVGEAVVGAPARGADLVWVITLEPGPVSQYRLKAYPATGSSTQPLRVLDLVGSVDGNADIAIGSGTVLVEDGFDLLTAFRIPGTWERRSAFVDVPPGAPFARNIEWLAREGITQGSWDGRFRPDAPVIRQAMAVFLHDMVNRGATPEPCTTAAFPDVPASSPYCGSIAWLAEAEITRGTSDGRFRPLGTVTREAMAAFLYHLAHHGQAPAPCAEDLYADVPASSSYCGSIAWLAAEGITLSAPDGNFGPRQTVTREMMAAFLHRLDGVLADARQ